MHTNTVKEKLSIFLLTSAGPLIFTILWLARNNQLPGNDASNYLMTAINIYQSFIDHGFWSGLWHFYTERGWRPIIFPNLAVPSLLISHGNVFFTYWSVACINLIASTSYIYLFLRLRLDRFSAIVVTNLIGLLPLIQAQILMFYSEGAFFVCFLGCLYHLIKSDYLQHTKHAFGFAIMLTLSILLRPIEAVTQVFFVIIYFIANGWMLGIFNSRQIAKLLLCCALALTCYLIFAAKPYFKVDIFPNIDGGGPQDIKMAKILFNSLKGSAICVLLISAFLLASRFASLKRMIKKHFMTLIIHQPLLTVFSIVLILTLIWFIPAAYNTYQWIYRTSLGDVALSTGSLNGSQFSLAVLGKYVQAEGQAVVYVAVFLAMFAMVIIPKNNIKKLLLSSPVIYLLLTIPFPLWESFYTVQVVTRKLSFAFPVFLMAMSMIALEQGRWWATRLSVMTILTAFQFALLITLVYTKTYTHPNFFLSNTIGYFIPQPVTISPNPHDVVISFLKEQALNYKLQYIGLEVMPGSPDARHPTKAEPVDPFLLSTTALITQMKFASSYPYFSVYSDKAFKELNQRYDAIFIADRIENMVVSEKSFENYKAKFLQEKNQSIKVYYNLLMHYSKNQLVNVGWSLGPCTVIKTQSNNNYLGCIAINSQNDKLKISRG